MSQPVAAGGGGSPSPDLYTVQGDHRLVAVHQHEPATVEYISNREAPVRSLRFESCSIEELFTGRHGMHYNHTEFDYYTRLGREHPAENAVAR